MTKFNPRPVFTETIRLGLVNNPGSAYQMNAQTGGLLQVQMDMLPQLVQYSNLYTKYRILKVQYLCLATWNTSAGDINLAESNSTAGLNTYGQGRVVHVNQESPGQNLPPLNEAEVLQCNGAKIVPGKQMFKITTRPVPNMIDSIGNQVTKPRSQFLNFATAPALNVIHGTTKWWYTLPVSGGLTLDPFFAVYAKVTFQLADPR